MDLLFLSEHLRNIAGDLLPQILVPLVQQSSGLTRNCWNLKRLFQINDCLDQPGPDCDDIVNSRTDCAIKPSPINANNE